MASYALKESNVNQSAQTCPRQYCCWKTSQFRNKGRSRTRSQTTLQNSIHWLLLLLLNCEPSSHCWLIKLLKSPQKSFKITSLCYLWSLIFVSFFFIFLGNVSSPPSWKLRREPRPQGLLGVFAHWRLEPSPTNLDIYSLLSAFSLLVTRLVCKSWSLHIIFYRMAQYM